MTQEVAMKKVRCSNKCHNYEFVEIQRAPDLDLFVCLFVVLCFVNLKEKQ